jgi:hypothetical protein
MRAGHDCPFAHDCRSKVVIGDNGKAKIVDGKHTKFRCFGASSEIRSKHLRDLVARNAELVRSKGLKNTKAMANLIDRSIPEDARVVRVHTTGGDFMTEQYLQAWMDVAEMYPDVIFYGYTKALPYYVKLKDMFPDNFRFTPSRGGTHDHLIDECGLHEARVVNHPDEADALGWPIDHDDSHAMAADHSFCLLLHGQQPAGSDASEALKFLRKSGTKYGYSRGKGKDRKE